MWGWQCVGGWHGGYFFLSFVVAGARGRGRKRGKGKESEIVKYIYLNKLGKKIEFEMLGVM